METSAEKIANVTLEIVAECGLSKDVENVVKIQAVLLVQIASMFFLLIEIKRHPKIIFIAKHFMIRYKLFIFIRDRKCIAPRANGMSCVPDSDCASGHCCGVVPFKRCQECCKDSHCPSGQNCK